MVTAAQLEVIDQHSENPDYRNFLGICLTKACVKAKADAKVIAAQAKAEASKIKAQTKAETDKIKAQAKADKQVGWFC
jgi:hypothetical protein